MTDNKWYDVFMEILSKKYPKKNLLAEALMDLLCIEREAVYRRLRQDVMFTANEIVKIASAWNVSLDKIANSDKISFLMQPINYFDPSEEDLKYIRRMIKFIRGLKSSDSEYMEICNKLPRSLNTGFPHIYKFYMFKWAYQYYNEGENVPYSQTVIPDTMLQIASDYYSAMENVANSHYIFDHNLFNYLVCDIQYFNSIQLITDEEKELIKNDLKTLLNYLSEVASLGYFPATRKNVGIYISQINIDTNYSYFSTKNFNMFRIHAFNKYETHTYDEDAILKFKNWMQLKKRSSVLISAVDEKSRVEFFTKQHQIIDDL